ncbi:MAG: polysaccharide biosynthesis tyrosine autokinase [Bacteroidales bacterium]|nr:polysaccharide biosynthesis tyrosine autokinase [Bacteroidales bacterium]
MKNDRIIPVINDQFDANVFFHIVKKSKWWVVAVFVFVFAFTGIYLRYSPRLFESSAVIQINNENSSSKILDIDNLYEEDQLAQIVELMKSRQFLTKILQQLPLKISFYNKGTFLSEELYRRSPINVSYKIREQLAYNTPFYFEYIDNQNYKLKYYDQDTELYVDGKFDKWVQIPGVEVNIELVRLDYFTEIEKNSSNEFYFTFNNPSTVLSEVASNLLVSVKNYNASTIEISIKGKDALKTTEIVNAVAQGYLDYEIERKKESSKNILEFIDKQTSKIYQDLNTTEQDIMSFKQKNNIKDYGTTSIQPVNIFMSKIDEFEDAILNLDIEISSLNQIEKELTKEDDLNVFELIALASGTSSENIVSNILNKLQELLTEKELLLNDVTNNNHKILVINKQFENQKEILKEFIQTTVARLEKQKKNYSDKVHEYETKIFNESDYNAIELSKMERYYAIQDNFYQKLIERKAEYLISQAGYVSKNTILESAATPTFPISPNKKIILIVAFVVSVLLVIVGLLLKYIFYNELSSIQELEFYTKTPILGSVPLVDMKNKYSQLVVNKDLKSIVTESFRTIRSNLDFYNLSPNGSIITVSSTVSGEGKTFVAVNLAGILAMRKKKVVIIDMDLRKPKVHHGMGVENGEGMSRVLSGHLKIDQVIRKTEIPTLDFITADLTPPNPSELIASEMLKKVLDELKSKYDFVIVDTSPIGLVADAIHLFKESDLPLYILKANYSKRRFIYNLDFLQNKKGIKHISIILNGINMSLNRNSYQYGYGYGYGYYDSKHQRKWSFRKLFFRK